MKTQRAVKVIFVIVVLAVMTACGGGSSGGTSGSSEDLSKRVAKVVIAQESLMFTEAGQQRSLTARAFNAAGDALQVPISWQSSDPDSVYVDDVGEVESIVNVGSASITAKADGVSSAAVVAVVAALAAPDSTLIVGDANVVSMALVDPNLPLSSDTQYTVTLTGVTAPAVGDLLLGTEEVPVYGRVIAVAENAGKVTVTLDIPPVSEMFSELDIAETIDLSQVEPEVPIEIERLYRMQRQSDGTLTFVLKETPSGALSAKDIAGAFNEIFSCEGDMSTMTIDALPAKLSIKPDIDFIFAYHSVSKLFDARIKGSVEASAMLTPMINLTGEAKVVCETELVEIPVPALGVLSWVMGPSVPVGYGFEVGGKATLAQIGVELKGVVGGQFEAGLKCPSGQPCASVSSSDGKLKYSSKLVFPDQGYSSSNLRVEAWLTGYTFAKMKFGVAGRVKRFLQIFFRDKYKFEFLTAKLGPKTSFNLATSTGQILSGSYKSAYGTDMEFAIGTATDTKEVFKYLEEKFLINVNVVKLEFVGTLPLYGSPASEALTTTTYDFVEGDSVVFNVSLNPVTTNDIAGLYNVSEVRIYEDDIDDMGKPMARLLAVQKARPGQVDFSVNWTADFDGPIGEDFYAFVETKALPSIDTFDGLGILELGNIKSVGASPCADYEVFLNKKCVNYYRQDIPDEAEIAAIIDEPVVCPLTHAERGYSLTIPADGPTSGLPYVSCRYWNAEVGAKLVNQEHFGIDKRTGVSIYFNEDGTIRDYIREAATASDVQLAVFIDASRFVTMIRRTVESEISSLTVSYFPDGTPGLENGSWGYIYNAGQADSAGDLWVTFNSQKGVVSVIEFGAVEDKYMYFKNGLLTECTLRSGNGATSGSCL